MPLDKNDLLSLIASELPDNTTELIAPTNVRTTLSQMVSSAANLQETATQEFIGPVTFSGGVNGLEIISNRIVINEYADFPNPLLPNTEYYIGGEITLPNTLPATWGALPVNIVFRGSLASSRLTWNGTGTLFTGVDMTQFVVDGIYIDAANGTVFNITDVSPVTILSILGCRFGPCVAMGNINVLGLLMDVANIADADQGFVTGDKLSVLSLGRVVANSTSATFVYVDISLSVMSTVEISNNLVIAPAGAIGIKGLAGSANITANNRASVSSCEFIGGVTPLNGITENDIRYNFESNSGIRDTCPDALITLTGNATATVISATSTDGTNAVLVAGAWVLESTSQYSTTAAGRVTALFERTLPSPITASLTVEPVSGTNQTIAVYFRVNGTIRTASAAIVRTDNNDPKSLTVIWQEEMSTTANTYVELFVENRTSTANILVSNAVLRVR